ncbi:MULTISPECIES: hypothetical protein [Ehrlichia]|uniref:Uncharacterized protein n=1 Tax=Ehrlichia cf. muris str. EmCRT TaxID=1359167 RepID=A0A0F3NBC6_9RICK|nr:MULTISPECIES: hypothetical protein [Ehrlichia]KJV65345.1 hypothetical protein EMUCRT_0283 [Ehrlichia cf. muris str. EmCRT]OUC04867.1 hypothetical protein DB91_00645 [Ehrlichia sp. Wisconsin_h]
MQLMLLSYGSSQLVLLPVNSCSYNKELDICHTGNPNIDMQLVVPLSQSIFYGTLYRSILNDYSIVTNAKSGENIVFLYGKNPVGHPMYVVFICPIGTMHTVFQQGIVLDSSNFVSAGMFDQSMFNESSENKTLGLFDLVSSSIEIVTKSPVSYLTRLSYFNSSGNLFHTDYKTAILKNVSVDPVTNSQICYMKLQ